MEGSIYGSIHRGATYTAAYMQRGSIYLLRKYASESDKETRPELLVCEALSY